MSSSTSAASALANLLAHSPASPQVAGPSEDPSPSENPSHEATGGSKDQPAASTIASEPIKSSLDRPHSILVPENDTVFEALSNVHTPALPPSAPTDLGARASQDDTPSVTRNEATSPSAGDAAAPLSITNDSSVQGSEAEQPRSASEHQSKRDTLRPFDSGEGPVDWEFWKSVTAGKCSFKKV